MQQVSLVFAVLKVFSKFPGSLPIATNDNKVLPFLVIIYCRKIQLWHEAEEEVGDVSQ